MLLMLLCSAVPVNSQLSTSWAAASDICMITSSMSTSLPLESGIRIFLWWQIVMSCVDTHAMCAGAACSFTRGLRAIQSMLLTEPAHHCTCIYEGLTSLFLSALQMGKQKRKEGKDISEDGDNDSQAAKAR